MNITIYALLVFLITLNVKAFAGQLDVHKVWAYDDDGNVAENVLDEDLNTRWSDYADTKITFDLGGIYKLNDIKIAFYKGDERYATFAVYTSATELPYDWHWVRTTDSSGDTVELEAYSLGDVEARFVRIVGHGNEINDWTSITEVEIHGEPLRHEVDVIDVWSYDDNGNVAENVLDKDLTTHWSDHGNTKITFDLGEVYDLKEIDIAWYKGDERYSTFTVQVSDTELPYQWVWVRTTDSSGDTLDYETYSLGDVSGRFVRIVGHGNEVDDWTSITDVKIIAQ